MMNNKFLLRFDADERVGMGHFTRCRALSEEIRSQGLDAVFAVKFAHNNVESILWEIGQTYIKIPGNILWRNEAEFILENGTGDVSVVLLDISTPYAFQDPTGVSTYLKVLREHYPVILLDGLGDNALAGKINVPLDMVVTPYFGAEKANQNKKNGPIYLSGPKYFIFGAEYNTAVPNKRKVRDQADRVLITFGGTDPKSITLKALDAIFGITNHKFYIRVIVGPGFNPELKEKIEKKAKALMHTCEVVYSPPSLVEHMLWCDIAVVSSGLTKYELALTGTPSIQISINEEHACVNKPFARTGVAEHLGIDSDVDIEGVQEAVVRLIGNPERRRTMSEIGQSILDTQGVARIVEAIRRL